MFLYVCNGCPGDTRDAASPLDFQNLPYTCTTCGEDCDPTYCICDPGGRGRDRNPCDLIIDRGVATAGIWPLVRKDWCPKRSPKCPPRVIVRITCGDGNKHDAIKYTDPHNPTKEIVAMVATIHVTDVLDPRNNPLNPCWPRPVIHIGMELDPRDIPQVRVRPGQGAASGQGGRHHRVVPNGETTVYRVIAGP